MVNVVTNIL